jgi:hypothetical protein
LDAEKRIIELLKEVALPLNSSESELTRDSPIRFDYIEKYRSSPEPGATFTAWFYDRFNDVTILRIDLATDAVEHADVREIERWVRFENGRIPFTTIRIQESENRRVCLNITHSFVADDVTTSQLTECFEAMLHVWRKCSVFLEELLPLVEEGDFDDDYIDPSVLNDIANAVSLNLTDEGSEKESFLKDADVVIVDNDPEGESVETVLAELNSLIGLTPVKSMIEQLSAQQKIAALRKQKGLPAVTPSPHLVFLGNPGTGKTTVARLIGRLYKAFGLLSKGHVVEADRSSLVAGFIGQTAIKTREACERALGGILFIDEAYSLNGGHRDYGAEAIETLLTFMEAHRGDFAVVVAGYPFHMFEFMNSNPGLKSRFDITLDFPDYSTDELMTIFQNLLSTNQYSLSDDAREKAYEFIDGWRRDENFGNAREIRRLFHNVIGTHAALLAIKDSPNTAALQLISAEAIPTLGTRDLDDPPSAGVYLPGYL